MPVFVDDIDGATKILSAEEFGCYTRIRYAMWRAGGQGLPDDSVKLARICGVSERRWRETVRPALLPYFSVIDGTIQDDGLNELWRDSVAKMLARSEKASRGGQATAARFKSSKSHEPGPLGAHSKPAPSPLQVELEDRSPSPSEISLPAEESAPAAPPPKKARRSKQGAFDLPAGPGPNPAEEARRALAEGAEGALGDFPAMFRKNWQSAWEAAMCPVPDRCHLAGQFLRDHPDHPYWGKVGNGRRWQAICSSKDSGLPGLLRDVQAALADDPPDEMGAGTQSEDVLAELRRAKIASEQPEALAARDRALRAMEELLRDPP